MATLPTDSESCKTDKVRALFNAAQGVLGNLADADAIGPDDPDPDVDWPTDGDGNPWFHDLWDLNEALKAIGPDLFPSERPQTDEKGSPVASEPDDKPILSIACGDVGEQLAGHIGREPTEAEIDEACHWVEKDFDHTPVFDSIDSIFAYRLLPKLDSAELADQQRQLEKFTPPEPPEDFDPRPIEPSEYPEACSCPMPGCVVNVDCPVHGKGVAS